MKTIRRMAADGWHVKIWPHHRGYTVSFHRMGDDELVGRGLTVGAAAKAAVRVMP